MLIRKNERSDPRRSHCITPLKDDGYAYGYGYLLIAADGRNLRRRKEMYLPPPLTILLSVRFSQNVYNTNKRTIITTTTTPSTSGWRWWQMVNG